MMIVPSILSDSMDIIESQMSKVSTQTNLRRVQIDIIDPDFAPEVTIHPIDLIGKQTHGFDIDIHLMTNDPINDVVECSQIPGIHTIIAQIERMPSQKDFFEHVESLGLKAGFSLDIYTPVEEIDATLLPYLDVVQIMGNKAGKQGQSFVAEVALEKIKQMKMVKDSLSLHFLIAVDIGMNPENAKTCALAGADMITPGSYLWNSKNLQEAIEAYH